MPRPAHIERQKVISWTPLVVDDFGSWPSGKRDRLLTHAHQDHCQGLSSRYKHGLIYCTPCTAGLVQALLDAPEGIFRMLELDMDYLIAGCTVTAMDANHSPGSCMFVIQTPPTGEAAGKTIVHTGDFYWLPEMALHKALRGKQIDALYLDTTNLDLAQEPPSQAACLVTLLDLVRNSPANTLFVLGLYSTGKEQLALAVAEARQCQIFCTDEKRRQTLKYLELTNAQRERFTEDQSNAGVVITKAQHARDWDIGDLNMLKHAACREHVLAIRPTGRGYIEGISDTQQHPAAGVTTVQLPYTSHSTPSLLHQCVTALQPRRIIPTAHVTADKASVDEQVARLKHLTRLVGHKSEITSFFKAKPTTGNT